MSALPSTWPIWLQVFVAVIVIATPFLTVLLNYHLKDKRAARQIDVQEDNKKEQALVDDQQGFIDRILKSAEMAPKLLEQCGDLMRVNSTLQIEIQAERKLRAEDVKRLQGEIDELKNKVMGLEQDRDMWRGQAQRVPQLEGQIMTLTSLLKEKEAEIARFGAGGKTE